MPTKLKLKKGDRVKVIAGKDLGSDGVIMRVIPEKRRVIVEGVNVAKKHQRPTRAMMQSGIIDKDMPIHISNVAIICGTCGPTRIAYRVDAVGDKARICRKCRGEV